LKIKSLEFAGIQIIGKNRQGKMAKVEIKSKLLAKTVREKWQK